MINYNFLQRSLHNIFLSNFFKKTLYDLEKLIFLKSCGDIKSNEHVFITGLPRSGTTATLNFLYNTNDFVSLTYRNMPFLMAPNLNSFFKQQNPNKEIPRYHNDGIYININSPEALDEIFISTFKDNTELKLEYNNFIKLILKNNYSKKYLSKNNLNYKRINLINELFPNSKFLILFRDPIKHAHSLHKQHLNFLNIQKKNKFILKYMNHLNHFEFGSNHKPWNKSENYFDFIDQNYWLEQWYLFYKDIINQFTKNKKCFFICYEDLANDSYQQKLLGMLNVSSESNFKIVINSSKPEINFNENLYLSCLDIYKKMKNLI